MFTQKRHSGKRLATTSARILFDIGMSLEMSSQIRAIGKGSAAVVTRERFLTRVGADVSLQQPRSGECLAAKVALARESVGPNVHFQRTQGGIYLCAIFAAERFPSKATLSSCAVVLLVFGETRVRRVGFSTIGALIARASGC